jgi:twinkle protein
MTDSDNTFIRHEPCPACGSRDNLGRYADGGAYCFGCGHWEKGDGESRQREGGRMKADLISGEVVGLPVRGITEETARKFNYQYGQYKGKPVQIAPYYDSDGNMVAQKLRSKDKSFTVLGDLSTALPFGSHAFSKSGKMIVVTEGEIDALSMSQTQGNKWPVVSISCGAGAQVKKYMAKHKAYFDGFDQVIIMFDNDEPGRQAAKIAASIIGHKARIAELPLKDANEMLVEGRVEEMINAMWRATEYRPEGIVDMVGLKDAVMERPHVGLSWAFPSLTALTYGIRTGELYAFGAGTGIGKTDFFAQNIVHLIREHGVSVGVFSLEQNPTETATRIAGKISRKPFHIPQEEAGWEDSDLEAAWVELQKSGKVFLYDSFGNNDWEVIKEKIEYLANAEGVRYFFLDHLTALAAWQDDERKALEIIMSDMGSLVKKLDIALFFVSHLATPEGKPHEEGGRVMIRHFKGSRAIGYWSHYMIGMERDQQSDDMRKRMTTSVRVLKDRYTGRATGQMFYLGYDFETGMLFEAQAPEDQTGTRHGFKDESMLSTADRTGDF